jgi:hypothetical protein
MVGASKRFINPEIYDFALATCYSIDGGHSWIESAPLALGHDTFGRPWGGISDPALTWDSQGNVFLVALPFAPNDGHAQHRRLQVGEWWVFVECPKRHSLGQRRQAVGGRRLEPEQSVFWQRVCGVGRRARTVLRPHDRSWGYLERGGNKSIAETVLADDSFSPEISVGPDGAIYIV